jgi:iron(III) transport system substrate-binding protein
MGHPSKLRFVALLAALVLAVAGCGESAPTPGDTNASDLPTDDQGDIAELVAAAQEEGRVTWLTALPQGFATETAAAFKEQFGIEVEYISLNSGPLIQRFQTEAEAGALSIDVTNASNLTTFADEAFSNGWAVPLADAELPVLEANEYPEMWFEDGKAAVISVAPYLILLAKDRLTGDMEPRSLEDLADPKYQGQLLMVDPSSSDSLYQFYNVMLDAYGEAWFAGIRANEVKFFPTVSNAAQAMTAGEGSVTWGLRAVAAPLVEAGAPVGINVPPVTTGSLQQLMLTAPDQAPHPNAAKLFANWWLSESGNRAANGELGVSPYDSEALAGFQVPEAITPEIKAEINGLLGLG